MQKESCHILLLESATDSCSVALSDGETLLCEKYLYVPKVHDKMMASLADQILKENGITTKECVAVAVSSGPGSYMGLRIGASLAKGIAYGAGIKLVAVNTLAVIAQCALDNSLLEKGETEIVPMIDAGRMEVYTATFSSDMDELSPTAAKVLDTESFAQELKQEKILFTGNGAAKFKAYLEEQAAVNEDVKEYLKNASFKEQLPRASGLRKKAFQAIKNSKYESVAYFEPFYLKDFIPGKPKKLL